MRILIVDDDLTSRRILSNILIKYGQCNLAKSGQEAIDQFRGAHSKNNPFHLITLDFLMPDLSGPTVFTQIRKFEKNINIQDIDRVCIIMVTTQNNIDSVMKAISIGCTDYIVKPLDYTKLERKLQSLGFNKDGKFKKSEEDELKDIFVQEFGKRIKKLKQCLLTRDMEKIKLIGHQLHGTGSAYGFTEVTVAGAKLEEAVKKGVWSVIKNRVNTLEILYRRYSFHGRNH